jgi:dipeptidyl aminopeptidase/acylaminoacyl peptidase
MTINRAAFLVAITLFSFSAEAESLSLSHYLDWENAGNPQVSPDGKRILFSRSRVNKMTDGFDSEVWQMEADGNRQRFLLKGSAAAWSPSGDRVAYIAPANGKAQLFVRWMDDEGAVSQITWDTVEPKDFRWSPDGQWIAFRAEVPMKPAMSIKLPDRPPGAEWTEDPPVIDKLHYRVDRVGLKTGYNHLFVVPSTGGTPRQLTEGKWDVGRHFFGIDVNRSDSMSWTADSSALVFSAVMDESDESGGYYSGIHKVDVSSHEITTLVDDEGSWGSPLVSPDGRHIVYLGNRPSPKPWPVTEIRMMNVDGSNNRLLRDDIDNPFLSMQWERNSRSVLIDLAIEGSVRLARMAMNGDFRTITADGSVISTGSARGNTALVRYVTSTITPNIASVDLRNGEITQLTDLNADILRDVTLGNHEEIWYESTDNTRVHGWVITPPDFDPERKYPLLLMIHGGPHGMYTVGFNFRFQEFASEGYVVLYTNPRGSTGYGFEFTDAIDNSYPGRADFDDLMAGVDAVFERGYIDEERMFVAGCSGGGVLTAWVVANTDRFAAAASLCPVINWLSMAGTSDVAGWAQKQFRGEYYEDPAKWIAHSPLFKVADVTTPTLLMTGENDLRTPLAQAEEFYAALKKKGVSTVLIPIKGEWHGTWSKPSNLFRTQLYLRKWFDQHGGTDEVE